MKPTILFILHLPPPVHGAAMMGQYIHDSKLINETFQCHYINLALAKNLQDIGKGGWRKLRNFLKLLFRIRKEVKRLKPDLVYVTPNACGGAFYKDFVVVQMLKSMGCKVVAHYHNKGVSTRQDRLLDNFLYRRFFKGLKVILLAEALYPDVRKYVKREDVLICPNGIPETLDSEPSAERHNEVPHLLFLSNLIVSKGVWVLLDALKLLKERGYSFTCDFVGGETKEISALDFEREVEKRGLNQIAVYRGRKYGKEKTALLKQADVFTFPTYNDAFPLVNLEAMEYKLPIVTTDEGGITDVVKDGVNGLICEKQCPDSLAACVEQLLNADTMRRKMGEKGYQLFKQHFTLPAFERRMEVVLTDVIGGGVKCNLVFYCGKRFGTEKRIFFENADIFVFPTFYHNEAFPLVNLEAMEYKLPIVTTTEGGIPDMVKDGVNGLICERQNPEALAAALSRLMDDKALRSRMGEAGYGFYKERFTLLRFEERMREVLGECLGS